MTTTQTVGIPDPFHLSGRARSALTFRFEHTEALPTGANIRCAVRKTKYSPLAAIEVDGTAGIVVVGNVATVTFTAAQTDLDCGWYTWLLEATIAGVEVPLAGGLLDLAPSPLD